ncbi:MAG TPA: RIP metalloprotease RseP [Bacteroidia bacterium]|jgi:regulator of sigma E protease|nr:RIP metalloprotease RseP [Bacteroidia bacterium]
MEVLTQAAQFILSLSILIVLHELGHFIPAKLFKTRVEKFYLFFDPKFSLFKVKKGETEYGIGWLPLGGYVKISGMIDESMDKEQMAQPPQPWEFRAKPAWQRLIIMLGGVTVNVLLGIFIYAMVLFAWGEEYLPTQNAKYGIAVDSLAYKIGLRDGDMIASVDHKPVENFSKVWYDVLINEASSIEVKRDGKELSFPVTEDHLSEMIQGHAVLIEPRIPFNVDSIYHDSPAEKVGIKKNDHIISLNGQPITYFQDFSKIAKKYKNQQVDIGLIRNNDTLHVKPTLTAEGQVMMGPDWDLRRYFTTVSKTYGFASAFPAGIRVAHDKFNGYLKQLKLLFTIKGAHKEVGGFLSMGKSMSTTWDWQRFWSFTAFLSIALAIMNILPIPALDGGHVMFLLYEVITRRKPNEKFMEYAQYVGMFILLGLLLYANGNDVLRLIK